MKYTKHLIALILALMLQGCWGYGIDDDAALPPAEQNFKAVTMQRSAFENAISLSGPKEMTQAGKIYIKDNLMYVNDVNKGFHIYNYADPDNPVAISYIAAPGATDLAIRGNNLYINQAVDLVTVAYTTTAITVTGRNRNVFPQKEAPDGSYKNLSENEIIINWIPK